LKAGINLQHFRSALGERVVDRLLLLASETRFAQPCAAHARFVSLGTRAASVHLSAFCTRFAQIFFIHKLMPLRVQNLI
jgi:hypothetical protein